MYKIRRFMLILMLSLLTISAVAQEPEINGYIGDKPLSTYSHDTIKGGLTFSVGDSFYSEKLWPGDSYTIHTNVSLPDDVTVIFARLYNYWTWSAKGTTGMIPDMKLTFDGITLEPEQQYSDRKQWGTYDYPSGTWAYDVTSHVTDSTSHTVVVENTGPSGAFFCMSGVGLLVVYADADGQDIEYWVNEGCDMLNSQMEDDGTPKYYTTPNQTITDMLNPEISREIQKATLWTIVQSGNWDADTLWVNDMNWTGICDGTPLADLDVDRRDITAHMKAGKNTIQFQAVDDYAVPSGSFLAVEIKPSSMTPEHIDQSAPTSKPKGTPGFGAVPTIVLVLITAVLTFRKSR